MSSCLTVWDAVPGNTLVSGDTLTLTFSHLHLLMIRDVDSLAKTSSALNTTSQNSLPNNFKQRLQMKQERFAAPHPAPPTESLNSILGPVPDVRSCSLSPRGRITAIALPHRAHAPAAQKYLEKTKGSGLARWIINVFFSKAKQHLELFACYLTLCILHKYCYTLQNQIAHRQYTCRAIEHKPTPKPDCLYH